MCKSKIQRLTVTECNLYYEGSITVDRHIMDAAGLHAYEMVLIVNINNGARFETYIIEGKARSGVICLNGAAARLAQPKDLIIIISSAYYSPEEVAAHQPQVIVVDKENRLIGNPKAKARQ